MIMYFFSTFSFAKNILKTTPYITIFKLDNNSWIFGLQFTTKLMKNAKVEQWEFAQFAVCEIAFSVTKNNTECDHRKKIKACDT